MREEDESMYELGIFVGAVWFGIGIYAIKKRNSADTLSPGIAATAGIMLLVLGTAGICSFFVKSLALAVTGVFLPCIIFLIGTFIGILWHIISCNEMVYGTYRGYKEYYGGKGQHSYAPVFEYSFGGQIYVRQMPVSYGSLKKLAKKYQLGERYPIYINAGNPKSCIDSKRMSWKYVLILLLGLIMLAAYAKGMYYLLLWEIFYSL